MPSAKVADTGRNEAPSPVVSADPGAIRAELGRILESRHFRHSRQGSRFLQYIVDESLNGNAGLLKERLLGAALFGRVPDYATGDDPIVRVQANDVRRRLEAYAAEHLGQSLVLIELPPGSYIPHIRTVESSETPGQLAPTSPHSQGERLSNGHEQHEAAASSFSAPVQLAKSARRERPVTWIMSLSILVVLCAVVSMAYQWRSRVSAAEAPERLADAFWQPVLASQNPVVISIGKVIVYRPSDALYHKYAQQHPGAFATGIDRLTRPLPLKAGDPLRWSDFDEAGNQGFSMGSMRSSMNLAGFLAQRHKAFCVRLGVESSFAELRNAPAVLIGAFNNRWTLEMTSGLHFTFAEPRGQASIHEESSGRDWARQVGPEQAVTRDYGLITRLLAWKTGQPALSVGGLGHGGTTAATEMITNPGELAEVLKSLPRGWEQKNVQLVISADTTDEEAGRPTLVAYYVW